MLDIKWIRENQEAFVEGLESRGLEKPQELLNRLLSLDEERRGTIQKLQTLQARRNAASKEVGQAKAAKDEVRAVKLMDEVAEIKGAIQLDELTTTRLDAELHELLSTVPNLPLDDVPVGDESANTEIRKVGTPPKFNFTPKQHFELGEALGLMDFETAAKLSGARFVVLKGGLARLERALAQFMLDLHTSEHGYVEVNPPLLVRDETMFGTAQLPKFREDQFATALPESAAGNVFDRMIVEAEAKAVEVLNKKIARGGGDPLGEMAKEDAQDKLHEIFLQNRPIWRKEFEKQLAEQLRLWLIPTAEVPLTNLVRESIVDQAKLPTRVTAWTPCFRAEAGAAGKDTRGMIRQHQFSKVELVSITTPEQSRDEHERMTACAETVLKQLDIPYRVIVLSTGDMGFASQKTYDIEVWLPGQGTYREISSCSVCGDFQARRMNARYRPANAKETRFVHTLNGSGVAVGRALIAVLENYQEADGSIRVPDALKPYMGDLERITAPA